jgi:hypothetical protein
MINNLIELAKSSIDKSVELKLFKNKDDSSYAHLYKYNLEQIPLLKIKKGFFENFNYDRLKGKNEESAYPIDNRPKGAYNIEAVKFHRDLIHQNKNPLIFVVKKRNKYHLIHGSHKIVAANLEKLKKIDAYIVNV